MIITLETAIDYPKFSCITCHHLQPHAAANTSQCEEPGCKCYGPYGPDEPPPWADYGKPGASDCWSHYRREYIPSNCYIICYECGHVYTKHTLRKAWRKEYKDRSWWYRLSHLRHYLRATNRIYFCLECMHDF